jgi:hypothetical protein
MVSLCVVYRLLIHYGIVIDCAIYVFSGPVTIIVYLDETETWLQRKNVVGLCDSI